MSRLDWVKVDARALTVAPGKVRRVSCQTALDDYNVELDPGTYPVRFTKIDGTDCEPADAYWVVAHIPCTRLHDGARFGKRGDRGSWLYQMWGYAFAGDLS